nr:hypothetical protein [uncultured Dysgonomonas sp.]
MFLNAFFVLRVPRAIGNANNLTGVSLSASVAQPLADKRSRRKTKRADRQ